MKLLCKKVFSVFLSAVIMISMLSIMSFATEASCVNHNFDDGTITKEPTCTDAGSKRYVCLDCGCVKTEMMIPKGHIYDVNNLVIKEEGATCTTAGVRSYTLTCPVCDDILLYLEEPYRISHNYERVDVLEYSGCTTFGRELWGCTNCGKTEERQTLPQHTGLKGTGEWDVCYNYSQLIHCYECGGSTTVYFESSHNFIEYEVITPATCTTEGTAYVRCTRNSCEYFNGGYETIPATGHNLVWEEDVEPDCCMIAQYGGAVCSECGFVYEETTYYGEYFEHDFLTEILTPAKGNEKGLTLYTCQNETWSSMYHVFTVEYFVSDVIPAASENGTILVNAENTGVYDSIRDITGISEENVVFEVTEENNAYVDENGDLVIDGNGYVKVTVKTPVHEVELVIETVVCDSLEIIADDEAETGRILDIEVVKNPGAVKATDVEWTTSDESIVFVSDGRLVAVGTGKVVLTATVGELSVSKEITLVASGDAREIKFVAMDKLHYIIEDYYAVFNSDTLYWSGVSTLRFKVRAYETFPYETYIVYMNGEELTADNDGYYTVTADSSAVRITVTGAMLEENENGEAEKVSFWQALINFFKKIFAFLGIK